MARLTSPRVSHSASLANRSAQVCWAAQERTERPNQTSHLCLRQTLQSMSATTDCFHLQPPSLHIVCRVAGALAATAPILSSVPHSSSSFHTLPHPWSQHHRALVSAVGRSAPAALACSLSPAAQLGRCRHAGLRASDCGPASSSQHGLVSHTGDSKHNGRQPRDRRRRRILS